MAVFIFTNKRLMTVYPMAYMGMINLAQACLFSLQLVTFTWIDLCDFDDPTNVIDLLANSVFMECSWMSQRTGLTFVSRRSIIDLAGFIKLVDVCITIQVRILEIIFTTGINLDFIMTIIDSFNRVTNIKRISLLVNILSVYSVVSSIVILIYFLTQVGHHNDVDDWIEKIGIYYGYGLAQAYDIWVRNMLMPIEIVFLTSCLLVVLVGITRLIQSKDHP